jgi:hypothetical protein
MGAAKKDNLSDRALYMREYRARLKQQRQARTQQELEAEQAACELEDLSEGEPVQQEAGPSEPQQGRRWAQWAKLTTMLLFGC